MDVLKVEEILSVEDQDRFMKEVMNLISLRTHQNLLHPK